MKDPFVIIDTKTKKTPIILSVPHCGIEFPNEIKDHFNPKLSKQPDDTDWFVQDLYSFASDLGITIIHSKYSRWVIDLNRDPESKPLYNDGRIITGLCTTTDFFGNPIYDTENNVPKEIEINRRLEHYYWPYYQKLNELIAERKNEFGKVLLWDAHSIRQSVPTIQKELFPNMILGDNDEKTAHSSLIQTALKNLKSGAYQVNHNHPFKGGHITRYFGQPENNLHALQLEMSKILYMDDTETKFDEIRANKVRLVLRKTFTELISTLENLNC